MSGDIAPLKHKQRFFLSRTAESTFGTGAGATMSHYLNPVSGLPAMRLRRNHKDNTDQSTGYEGATVSVPLEYYMGPNPIGFYADAKAMGLFHGHLLATDTSVETSSSSGAFVHSFGIGANTGVFPGSFICSPRLESSAQSVDKLYYGSYVESITMSGGTTDFVSITPTISGCGATDAGGAGSDLIGPSPAFTAHKTRISIKPNTTAGESVWSGSYTAPTAPGEFANTLSSGGAIVLSTEGFESWTLTENLNVDQASKLRPGITSGAGAYQGCPNIGRRTFSLSVTGESTSTIQGLIYKYENQAVPPTLQAHYSVVIEFVTDVQIASSGVYYAGAVVMPVAQIMPVEPDDGERVKETLTFQAFSPTGGTANKMFYVYTVDDEEDSYGGSS